MRTPEVISPELRWAGQLGTKLDGPRSKKARLASLKFGSFGGLEWDTSSYGDRQLTLKLIEVGVSFKKVSNPEFVNLEESASPKRLSGLLDSALTELKAIKFILVFIAAALAVKHFIF